MWQKTQFEISSWPMAPVIDPKTKLDAIRNVGVTAEKIAIISRI